MFSSRDGILLIEEVGFEEIVEKTGTPVYITSRKKLEENIRVFRENFGFARMLYAVKANNNLTIMRIFAKYGFGADVFSLGELYLALLAGFDRNFILFNGNSKSDEEIEAGIRAGVKFSVDSLDELYTISEIAQNCGREVKIAFRVNPDIGAETHPKIATGLKTSKFGIPAEQILEAYEVAVQADGVVPAGIHCHIGSQIRDVEPFVDELEKMFEIASELEKLGVRLEFLDMGGGFGIDYEEDGECRVEKFAQPLRKTFERGLQMLKSEPELWIEPGRSLVANTTILLTRVNAVKKAHRNFVAVDAGFNLLIRPAMYDSYHRVAVANKMGMPAEELYTIAGPICESGDILAKDRKLPKVEKGDYIAVFDAGAYGFAMSSQYNGRPRCAEVLVDGGSFHITREKETVGDLIAKQRIPEELF
ncbi:diaminopimelate decarboxylase [Geoglobus acetivorans]|uniref:Diaminopimelate decarboxylase n=1 Tax=Geoglobus acetivorans TaxID=565033 RepID=A0A0A7GBE6_GEOAI|nr:Diaminopimelate decarboxylase [Geoglobus acetivorans]